MNFILKSLLPLLLMSFMAIFVGCGSSEGSGNAIIIPPGEKVVQKIQLTFADDGSVDKSLPKGLDTSLAVSVLYSDGSTENNIAKLAVFEKHAETCRASD
jgi:hypothetical protein